MDVPKEIYPDSAVNGGDDAPQEVNNEQVRDVESTTTTRKFLSRKAKETLVTPFQITTKIRSRAAKKKSKKRSRFPYKKGFECGQNKSKNRKRRRRLPLPWPKPQKDVGSLETKQDNSTPPFADETDPTPRRASGKTADWDGFLKIGRNLTFVPPVHWFKNTPLADIWEKIAVVGLVVEIPNIFLHWERQINWYATIKHYAGYQALVEFENLGISEKYLSWMSFCSHVPKHLEYSREQRILLHPPNEVLKAYPNFMEAVRQKYDKNSEIFSVMINHGEFIASELKKFKRFQINEVLEVLDLDNPCKMRLARVNSHVGDRIKVNYVYTEDQNDPGHWFNCKSEHVHPTGWSHSIGIEISGVPSTLNFEPLDRDYFPKYPPEIFLAVGQMLELRHPQLPHLIVGATIVRVLKYGYFMADISTTLEEHGFPRRFIFHVTSPYIFRCGFCQIYEIDLVPPYDHRLEGPFSWDRYFYLTNRAPAPLHLLPKRLGHKFQPRMKLEAIRNQMPTYLAPATIRRVCGHLLKLSFDNVPKKLNVPPEIWTHAESRNIYPLGYAEMVGHKFKGRVEDPNKPS